MIRQRFAQMPNSDSNLLSQSLGSIPTVTLTGSLGTDTVHFTCHGAATYWLYCEAFDRDSTTDFFSSDMFVQFQLMMGKLANIGRALEPTRIGSINLRPGTVLIFVNEHGHAGGIPASLSRTQRSPVITKPDG
jgi:hypothetical protein